MKYIIKYEPITKQLPWNIYKMCGSKLFFQKGFLNEDEARFWMNKRNNNLEKIEEAALESFPASDPPAWTGSVAHPHRKDFGEDGKCNSNADKVKSIE